MENTIDPNDTNYEEGEAELAALIKLAGEDARARKQKVMAHHFKLIKEIIESSVARQQGSIPK